MPTEHQKENMMTSTGMKKMTLNHQKIRGKERMGKKTGTVDKRVTHREEANAISISVNMFAEVDHLLCDDGVEWCVG